MVNPTGPGTFPWTAWMGPIATADAPLQVVPKKRHFCQRRTFQKMSCKSHANGVNGQSDWPWDLPMDRLDGPNSNRGCAATGCPKKRHFCQRHTFQKMSCKSHANGVNGQSNWPWDLPMDRLDGPNSLQKLQLLSILTHNYSINWIFANNLNI